MLMMLTRTSRSLKPLLTAVALLALTAAVAAVTLPVWKPYAKQWKWFVVSTNIYQDLLRRTGVKQDQIGQGSFERPLDEVPAALRRIDDLFAGTLRHVGLTPEDMTGRSVLEVGPGDNIGVALRFVAAGARDVVSIDKFVPLQNTTFHRQLYLALREELSAVERERFDQAIDLSQQVQLRDGPLHYVYGRGVDDPRAQLGRDRFDLITSNAVLEEVYDIDGTMAALDAALRPGGVQMHKIDLSDYGMFTKHGFHPLEFLTVPDSVYRLMVESTGQPNRRRIDYYRAKSAELGYDARILATSVVGEAREFASPRAQLRRGEDYTDGTLAALASIRPRLLPRYRVLSDEDLMVQGIVYVARKPAVRARR